MSRGCYVEIIVQHIQNIKAAIIELMINHKNQTVHLNLEFYFKWRRTDLCTDLIWPKTAWFQLNYQYTLLKKHGHLSIRIPACVKRLLDSKIHESSTFMKHNCLWQSRCSKLLGGWTCSWGNETLCHWWIPHTPSLVSECKDQCLELNLTARIKNHWQILHFHVEISTVRVYFILTPHMMDTINTAHYFSL